MAVSFPDPTGNNPDTGVPWANGDTFTATNGVTYTYNDDGTNPPYWSVAGTGGGAGTPNLQAVTDEGNTTTNEIVVNGVNIGTGGNANSTRVGQNALSSMTSGGTHVAVGNTALTNNTIGVRNTGIGPSALFRNVDGNENVACGYQTLFNNTSGTHNVALGFNAGNALTTGDNNTIIGCLVGTAGMANTMLFGAGTTERFRVDGNGNMMIGDPAHQMTDAKLTIGNGNSVALGFARTGPGGGGQFDGAIQLDTNGAFSIRNGSNSTTVAGLTERIRIDNDGRIVLVSSPGIQFGATNAGGAITSQTLDDYEEGTWTPEFVAAAGDFQTMVYSIQNGLYTKIGNRVFYQFILECSDVNLTGASGSLLLGGFPFTPTGSTTQFQNYGGVPRCGAWAGDDLPRHVQVARSSNRAEIFTVVPANTPQPMTVDLMQDGTGGQFNLITASGFYQTNE